MKVIRELCVRQLDIILPFVIWFEFSCGAAFDPCEQGAVAHIVHLPTALGQTAVVPCDRECGKHLRHFPAFSRTGS